MMVGSLSCNAVVTRRDRLSFASTREPNQPESVEVRQAHSLRQPAEQDVDLLAEDQILGFEPRPRSEKCAQRVRPQLQPLGHAPPTYLI